MEQTSEVCLHLHVGNHERGTIARDEDGDPEYYIDTVPICEDCGTIAPEPPRKSKLPTLHINHIQMELYLRASIMNKHGYIFTATGKSVKCTKCKKSWGIRFYKGHLNGELLKHAHDHEREESND